MLASHVDDAAMYWLLLVLAMGITTLGLALGARRSCSAPDLRESTARLNGTADALAADLIAGLKARGVKRLFIDGLGGLRNALVYPAREPRFFGTSSFARSFAGSSRS
jgi:hypothetical protein